MDLELTTGTLKDLLCYDILPALKSGVSRLSEDDISVSIHPRNKLRGVLEICYNGIIMGITTILATVKNIQHPEKEIKAKFFVDTGAAYTVLPAAFVEKLGLKFTKVQEFSLADGTVVTRKLGHAMVEIGGENSPSTVVLGEKDDSPLIGVITLENMGLMVDPFKRKLIPMKLMLG